MSLLLLLVTVPFLLGIVAYLVEDVRIDLGLLVTGALLHVGGTAVLWTGAGGQRLGAFLELDMPGLVFLSITSVLFLAASLYTVPYVLGETHDEQSAPRRFVPCLLWFLSAMTLVTLTHHLALLWAAVEATTLASAPLVYFYKRRQALEATWKYLLLCSVGIALALLGTFLMGIAATAVPGTTGELTLEALIRAAPSMPRAWLVAAFVFALVGYGTKMGLAPLHTWLPDTHSQAPSPVSALLSGSVLNCALLAIVRFFQIVLASGDAAFARRLLLVLGFVSLGLAGAFMVGQRDYKRLLAYSSIENMGIIAIGFGLGGAATYGALLHAVNHSLCKAGLFFVAGNVLRSYGTTEAAGVRGVFRRLPGSGVVMGILLFAIGGAPPFGPFWSELIVFRHALETGHTALGVLFLVLLAVAFLGMTAAVLPMLQGSSTGEKPTERESPLTLLSPIALATAVAVIGVWLPPLLHDALGRAAALLGG